MKNKTLDVFKRFSKCCWAGLLVGFLWNGPSAFADVLLSDNFDYANGLITNEWAFWNPGDPAAVTNPIWELDSGSFFANSGAGWTGVPDDKGPNSSSSNGNNSAIFRLNTKRSDFENVEVSFSLLNQGLSSTPSTPPVSWDGLHIWLHYQTEYKLYYASINRRDNTVVIKKKVPGGPSNGGTYYELTSYVPHVVRYNQWQQVKASVQTNANGTVTIKLYDGDTLLISATDDGHIGGPPITGAGKVGIRGDNANLKFDNFRVTTIGSSAPTAPGAPQGVMATPGDGSVTVTWNNVDGATSYNLYRSRFKGVTKATGFKVANVTSPKINTGFTNGTTYYMVVTAVNANGESGESLEVSAVPHAGPPAAPTNVVATPGNQQVTISWDPVPGASSYNLYRSRYIGVNKSNGYKIVNVTSPKVNTGFTNYTTYYMVVTALNAAGESVESKEVWAVPGTGRGGTLAFGGQALDLSSFRVFPNPWRADRHGAFPITFTNLTANTTIKIFTVAGSWVRTILTSAPSESWDLTNDSGQKVASGIYYYLITNDASEKKRGTLAVIQ